MARDIMAPHTRALIVAAAHAFVSGRKVAGLYDHSAERHRRIAAECRGDHLQGFDGDRSARFGGTLPEIYDAADAAFISVEIEGTRVRGYDRGSSSAYTADVAERSVQLYDHGQNAWFAFDVQLA